MSVPVDSAVHTIKSDLDQGIFDWDVTHGELIEINQKVIELTPQQRNELISKLSDDDLKNWTQEIDGLNGALTASERQELFSKLAEGLDGTQLTRLVKAFDGSPGGREALGTAVAQSASSEAKLAFIEATKGSINGDYKATQGRDGNAETVVIAKVLGSLSKDPAAFDKAIKSLDAGQLKAVMTVGLGRNHVAYGTASKTLYEPSAALAILDAATRSSDREVKTHVLAAAKEQLKLVQGTSVEKPLSDAVIKLRAATPLPGVPALEVEVNAFIPQKQVGTPGLGTFAGDGRNIGEDGTQRTQQTIRVYNDPTLSPPYRVEVDASIGETHKLDDKGNVVETGRALEDDLKAKVVEVRKDGTLVVQLSGQSHNPLVGVAPNITYDMKIEMRPNADGTWSITANGKHDAFPGYEVLAKVNGGEQQAVYGYDPRVNGSGPLSLAEGDGGLFSIWGDSSVNAQGSLVVGKDSLTAEALVKRHTSNGVVNAAELGRDLADSAEAGSKVDAAFVNNLFAAIPEGQRAAAANAFFDALATTPGVGGGPAHDKYASLALTPAGMNTILAVGKYAPERLAQDEILYGFASQNREAIYSGNRAASDVASRYLDALSGSPEAQHSLARYLEPMYSNDKQGIASTPEGRSLQATIERLLS